MSQISADTSFPDEKVRYTNSIITDNEEFGKLIGAFWLKSYLVG